MQRVLNKELNKHTGKSVKLCGWINSRRDHGKLIFIDLRDRTGLCQVVFTPKCESYNLSEKLRSEWVVEIEGKVNKRPEGMVNPKLETGKVEVKAD
jgi:aspartyl-tRNA synthetase